jgi:flavodoxin/Fe-S-cluster-containing hydrogenase component 2
MDVSLVYFSQTGNTRKVAGAMADAFGDLGHPVHTISLKKATPEVAINGDLLGVGCPCFTGQAPTPIKDFLRALPQMNGRRAFVFATSGGAPGKVLYDLTRLLRRKGADVIGGMLIRGECFHPSPCFIGRYPGRPNADDLIRAQRFAINVAEHIASGIPGPVSESRSDALKQGWGLYDFEGMFVLDPLIRLVLPKPKLDLSKCDNCQWCVYECPVNNIIMNKIPKLGGRCIRCYRCLTGCPQKAFSVRWLLGNTVLLSLHNTIFERWFGDLDYDEEIYDETDKPTSNWSFEMLLAALYARGNGKVNVAAARELGRNGCVRANHALISALKNVNADNGDKVREAAAFALGKIGDTRATEPLIVALRDKHKYVRLAAVNALSNMGNGQATEALISALKDEHWLVRKTAVEALGTIGTSQVVLPLLLALNDESPLVHKACREALGKIIECDSSEIHQD